MKEVKTWAQEDYDAFYGKPDYRGKVVLEIGADIGSTASFFFKKGVSKVISVEGDEGRYKELVKNAEDEPRCVPILLYVASPQHLETLIGTHKPDLFHADCEGCEVHLIDVRDAVFKIPEAYQLETHCDDIFERLREKLERNGYVLKSVNNWTPSVRIVYAVRCARQKLNNPLRTVQTG